MTDVIIPEEFLVANVHRLGKLCAAMNDNNKKTFGIRGACLYWAYRTIIIDVFGFDSFIWWSVK